MEYVVKTVQLLQGCNSYALEINRNHIRLPNLTYLFEIGTFQRKHVVYIIKISKSWELFSLIPPDGTGIEKLN